MTQFVNKVIHAYRLIVALFAAVILQFLLLILLVNIPIKARADFFSDLGECFTDPCNCFNHSHEREQWGPDGKTMRQLSLNTYDYPATFTNGTPPSSWPALHDISSPNRNCPPYNRYSGRKGCLYQFDAPSSPFLPTYRVYCAEADPIATYKTPTIVLRMQSCNLFGCWTQSKRLNALTSECVTWPTQYAIPTIRFCTRVAVNRIDARLDNAGRQSYRSDGKPDISYSPDPGYKSHFLDTQGFPRPDPGITNSSGYTVYLPKICLYEDPSFVEALTAYMEPYRQSGIDIFDNDIYSQPLHYDPTGANAGNGSLGVMDLVMGAKANKMVESKFYFTNDSTFFTSDMKSYQAGKTWDNSYADWVKEFAVNKRDSLGCTFLPIGPFPPPFCDTLQQIPQTVNVNAICPKTIMLNSTTGRLEYKTVDSTYTAPCAKSSVANNFINNAVRASIDDILPICGPMVDPLFSNFCVRIVAAGSSPRNIYDNFNDMLPKCNDYYYPTNAPCVTTKLTPAASNGKFRVIYGIKTASNKAFRQLAGYPSNIAAFCTNNANVTYPCVDIYGVNNGQYKDLSINLTNISDTSSNYSKLPDDSIQDNKGRLYTLKPYISFQGPEGDNITIDDVILPQNSMCLYYTAPTLSIVENAGCVPRAPYPLVSAYSCASPPTGKSCNATSTHFAPKILGELSYMGADGAPDDKAYLTLAPRDLTSNNYTNLFGYVLDSLVVDDDQLAPPFPASRQIANSPVSIWGQYDGNILPVNSAGTVVSTAKYTGKIEYYTGVYTRGGKKFVVIGNNITKCHTPIPGILTATGYPLYDNTNCVLSKLKYQDRVNCDRFKNENAKRRCSTPEETSCSTTTSVGITGSTNVITIKQCTSDNCYVSSELTDNICEIDTSPAARVIPSYTAPNVSLLLTQFYDYTPVTSGVCASTSDQSPYNPSKCAIRNKILIESGASTDIPAHPNCLAVTASSSSGNANWPETLIGNRATGTCRLGYQASGTLGTRLCYGDNNKNSVFEPITTASTCLVAVCPGIATADSSSGYATWTSVSYSNTSTPTCSGLTAPNGGFSPRACDQQPNGSYALNPINSGQWCYTKATASLAKSITLTASSHDVGIVKTSSSRVNNQTSYGCCKESCGAFGCCAWGRGTCYADHWSTVYKISIGHRTYFDQDGNMNSTINWLTPNTNKNSPRSFSLAFSASGYSITGVSLRSEGTTSYSTSGNNLIINYTSGNGNNTGIAGVITVSIPD